MIPLQMVPKGRTILGVGQDLHSIEDYLANVATDGHRPTTVVGYTDLQTLRGLASPVDYGTGVEYATGSVLLLKPKDRFFQLGLWLNGTTGCRDILAGALDANLVELFQYLVVDTPASITYVRVGYEFDNPSFGYSSEPNLYAQAFRTVVDRCSSLYGTTLCRSKIAFVWHSWAAGVPNGTILEDYYPGNNYVDWIGISVFSQLYDDETYETVGNDGTVGEVLSFAANHGKPTMIGESTPFGGIPNLRDPWNDWFEPVLDLIDEYDISMWCYINCDWDAQPMWNGVGFGNTRLAVNETILHLWNQRVERNPRFQPSRVYDVSWSGMGGAAFILIGWWTVVAFRRRANGNGYRPIR